MRTSQYVRVGVAEQCVFEREALHNGLEEKSREFQEKCLELDAKA